MRPRSRNARHSSSSSSTCLLIERRSCFAISSNRDLRPTGTRTSNATLGSVMATQQKYQDSEIFGMQRLDTL